MFVDSLVEVKECYEFGSSDTIVYVKGKLLSSILDLYPFSLAAEKKRLILDLRHVNKCLKKYRFKYEDWRVALSCFEKNAYMFSFDLKSGYHHIEIASEHQTFKIFHGSSTRLKVVNIWFFSFRFCLLVYLRGFTFSPNAFVLWKSIGVCRG